jgi:hypothetical protein
LKEIIAMSPKRGVELKHIRLELARVKDKPLGDDRCGYEFNAPLDQSGKFDITGWKENRARCTVRRFWDNKDDENGMLVHLGRDRWAFSYAPGEDDDEPLFKFAQHVFKEGEYVSITEHDGVTRPFKVVSIRSAP